MLETARAPVQRAAERVPRRTRVAEAGAPTHDLGWAQTLFAFAGGSFKLQDANIVRAGELLSRYLTEANEALRASFGAAALPENVAPSALTGPGGGTADEPGAELRSWILSCRNCATRT